jgi:hypothetical protein
MDRQELIERIRAKQGWYFADDGWWKRQPWGAAQHTGEPPDPFRQPERDWHLVEGDLMRDGWKFGWRGGVYVAYRPADKHIVTAEARDEVIARAWLEMDQS